MVSMSNPLEIDRVFRLDSWRDRLTLSLNYNDGSYTDVEAAKFLRDVADFMVAIAE
jgi:hypothetical protein